jgi:aldehyde:ferredoxin oxidoreductase
MECYEKGILTQKDTDGLELTFGNAEALVEMVERIASAKGSEISLRRGQNGRRKESAGDPLNMPSMSKVWNFPCMNPAISREWDCIIQYPCIRGGSLLRCHG